MTKKQPKISVIVAVYNTSKYIKRCLDSLLNQTYKNIEIIVIEDGSTDNSKDILDEYKNTCKIFYNEKNSGLAYSRNVGLDESTGDFVGFIDSDDYVDSVYYEKLMQSIIDNKSDISICDMKLIYEASNTELINKCFENEFNLINVVNNGLAASACNKLFKKSIINKYRFSVGKVNEDIAVVVPSLCDAKKISYAEGVAYNYVQRENSIQNSKFSEKRFDIFTGIDQTLERIKNHKDYDQLKDALIFNQIILLFIYVIPREKRFFYRYKILKKYYKLSKKYNIRTNKNYWRFLDLSGKKHAVYYRILMKTECSGLCLTANLLLTIYKVLIKLLKKSVIDKNVDMDALIKCANNQKMMGNPSKKVSVVIPNYNYEKFLYQRIYTILNQNYKIHEIIILDDCSKDNSRELIDEIYNNLKDYINIKKIYNATNSGSAFCQWKKGFENATGDYVWIAEADDYCEKELLSSLIKPILKDNEILISYSDTAFIDADGYKMMKSIKPEIDIQKSGHWNKSYINNGLAEIKNYSYLNNTIANVSSCIIKNDKNYIEYLTEASDYKQSGDWVFYVDVIKNGNVSYIDKPLNYYRVHGSNVSSVMNHKKHIAEINKIHSKFINEFDLGVTQKNKMKERIEFLKKCWKVK